MSICILLNGPPRCGKDTIGRAIWGTPKLLRSSLIVKFAHVLKERTHALYGICTGPGKVAPADYFEDCKDAPHPRFLGISPRRAYIEVSERLFKPVHGEAVWGKILAEALVNVPGLTYLVTDSGFAAEALALAEKFGKTNMLLMRIHRPGTDFSNDSRGYITLPGVRTLDVDNDTPASPNEIAERLRTLLPPEYLA